MDVKSFVSFIRNLKISIKLILSFGVVVFLLLFVIGYQVYTINYLKHIQSLSINRYEASERVRDIKTNLADMYSVFSDLLINRNFKEFEASIEQKSNVQRCHKKQAGKKAYPDLGYPLHAVLCGNFCLQTEFDAAA